MLKQKVKGYIVIDRSFRSAKSLLFWEEFCQKDSLVLPELPALVKWCQYDLPTRLLGCLKRIAWAVSSSRECTSKALVQILSSEEIQISEMEELYEPTSGRGFHPTGVAIIFLSTRTRVPMKKSLGWPFFDFFLFFKIWLINCPMTHNYSIAVTSRHFCCVTFTKKWRSDAHWRDSCVSS